MVAEVGKYYAPGEQMEKALRITKSNGETQDFSYKDLYSMGINPNYISEDTKLYLYADSEGNNKLTTDVTDLPMSIKLDTQTGNIDMNVPGEIYNSAEFQQTFDPETLKNYSQAYKLNPDYKVTVTEKDEETGETVEKGITIPEYIEKLNDALEQFRQGLKSMQNYRNTLYAKYGDKVKNMNLNQIQMSLQYDGDSIYFPTELLRPSKIGNKDNFFKNVLDKVDENGLISVKDLKEVYTRDNIGREEFASMVALIDGTLEGSEWGPETYEDENGEKIENPNSATNAAKLLAFRNFIMSNNPDSEWWQQAGDQIESFIVNAAYGVTRVFGNIANVAQTVVTLGNGTEVQNGIKAMDDAMEYFNTNNALVYDAVANAQILGYLGGTVGGTLVAGHYIGGAVSSLSAKASAALGAEAASVATESGITGVEGAASASAIAAIAADAENISTGARIMLNALSLADKTQLAINVASMFLLKGQIGTLFKGGTALASVGNFVVEFLADTFHDALLYDSTTLRDVMIAVQSSDSKNKQSIIDYWMGQLAENAMWWVPMGLGQASIKMAGKTALGVAANQVTTKYINKFVSAAGSKMSNLQNKLAGGNVIAKLQDSLKKAQEDGDIIKEQHLKNKIQIQTQKVLLRDARSSLGDLKLNWDGVKLTEESLTQFNQFLTNVKAMENALDFFRAGTQSWRRMMIDPVTDPSTGKQGYLYPTLAGANVRASDWYGDLVKLNKKYGLGLADHGSQISQDVIDYWAGSDNLRRLSWVASHGGVNAADAQTAAEIVKADVERLSQILPDEITKYIDRGIQQKVYPTYYKALNEFGYSGKDKVLDKTKVMRYDDNPMWQEVGYSPLKVKPEDSKIRFISDDGTYESIITEEMNPMTFHARAGQHYEDPELVRQIRTNHMAEAKNNSQIRHLYSNNSNATFITKVSGAETALVDNIDSNKKTLKAVIDQQAVDAFSPESTTPMFNIQKTKRRAPSKNVKIESKTLGTITASLSPSETSDILYKKHVLKSPDAKLTDGVTEENYEEWFKAQNKSVQKFLRRQYGKRGNGTFADLELVLKNADDDFEANLERAYLMGDKKFAKSTLANEAAKNIEAGKDAFYQGVVVAKIKGKLKNILNVDTDALVDEAYEALRTGVDDYVKSVLSNPGAKTSLEALADTVEGSEDMARYLALQSLVRKSNLDKAKEAVKKQVKDAKKGVKGLLDEDVDLLQDKIAEMFEDIVYTEYDNAMLVAKTIDPDFVDGKDVYDRVKEIRDRIEGAERRVGQDYIQFVDDNGQTAYAQVDPAFASLFNFRFKMERANAGVLVKVNAAMSKAFRYGTTSLSLSSFGNQLFRDFGNAIYVGGAWRTIQQNADNLVDVFGRNIVEDIKQFEPDDFELRQIEAAAKETGQTLEQAAVSRELMKGAAKAPSSTERMLYKNFLKEAYGQTPDDFLEASKTKIQQILKKWNPEDLLHGKRENYLRNRVYASALNDALEGGYTLQQARVFADYSMNNATTNFGRQIYHLQAIADSTPYFRAAINGTKSFWRMWTLDPVGITGRIMGGLIIPVMFFTGASLADEKNREVYKNLPEYAKSGSFIFVHDGHAISIPLPQELGPIVAPFRQFVEHLYDTNREDFWELMANDLLGFAPYDLTGFTAIDYDSMVADPTILDRISRGSARLFSQMAPVPVRSAYMIATGTDPYTGKSLRDPSYMYWNDETGSVEVMDYNSNAFAQWVATLFGEGVSPKLIERVVSGVIGTTGANLLGDLATLIQEGPEAALLSFGGNIVDQAIAPINVNQYNLVDAIWKRAISQLTAEKQSLLSSKKMLALNSELAQTKDPEKRTKILSERQTIVDEFQQKVGDTIKRLEEVYSGTFDRKKFAAVIQLLNFNSDSIYQSGSQYSSTTASDMFWDGRDAAIHTMQLLGVKGTSDTSIFGYLAVDSNGNPVVKYTSPVAIMDMEAQWSNQNDVHLANIKALATQNNLWDRHKEMEAKINAIYNKGKLSDEDYDAIDAIYIKWNAEVMSALAPYIEEMTPEAAINNNQVIDYLDGLIEVPGEFKKDKNGKYVTNTKLGNGSATQAYIRNYIKYIFGVNDTAYSSGRNYSDRTSYNKETSSWK